MRRARFVLILVVVMLALVGCTEPSERPATDPATSQRPASLAEADVVERSVAELQADMEAGRLTSVELVDAYLERIERYDRQGPPLRAMITVDTDGAREQALALDEERRASGSRGPLHGIPVLVKDSIDVAGMPTSGGTTLLADSVPTDDSFVVARLRDAGAIVLGKTNLDELQINAVGMSTLGGQSLNPYDPTRSPGGSSAGTGVGLAASFAAVGIGADTNGSIRFPSAVNALVGLRPTMGLISRDGSQPGTWTQDVLGPMARTVPDLAVTLDAIAGYDPADPVTERSHGELPEHGYLAALDADALDGARIGYFFEYVEADPADYENAEVVRQAQSQARRIMSELEAAGAVLVPLDAPVDLFDDLNEAAAQWMGAGTGGAAARWAAYLADTSSPYRTLDDLWADSSELFADHAPTQRAASLASLGGKVAAQPVPEAEAAFDGTQLGFQDTFAAYLDGEELDTLLLPTAGGSPPVIAPGTPLGYEYQWGYAIPGVLTDDFVRLSSAGGLPNIVFPAGAGADGLPIAASLVGRAFDDALLVALAYSYEQATHHREAPALVP